MWGKGMAVRRPPGDHPMFPRGSRVPGQVALLVPGRRAEHRAAQRRASRRRLDGRVGRVLLRHEPRFEWTQLVVAFGLLSEQGPQIL